MKNVMVWRIVLLDNLMDYELSQIQESVDLSHLNIIDEDNPVSGKIHYEPNYLYQADNGYGDIDYFGSDKKLL
jgi:hypothetical protein